MSQVRIPTRADDPLHLLMWQVDEVVPILAGFIVGIVVSHEVWCTLIGVLVTNLYRRFRDLHPDGYLLHLAYFYGFTFTKAYSLVNPFIRRFLP